MPTVNLSSLSRPGKAWLRGAIIFLGFAAVIGSACNTDKGNPLESSLPDGFSLKGTYFLTQRTVTIDGVNYETELPQNTSGVMVVEAEDSVASSIYERPAYPYERDYKLKGAAQADSGYVVMDDIRVFLVYKTGDRIIQGAYVEDDERIEVNYTESDHLYTETWKKVKETGEIYIPDDGLPYVP